MPRNNVEASFFHIMIQGINKEDIFNNSKNIEKYLSFIKEAQQDYDILIIVYCIMTNHAHFLVKANNVEELSKFMQKVNTKYAIYYNKINNRVGYVYRDRYKSQVITNIEHFYRCIEYIHSNPVKAGMCSKQNQYKYSSFYSMYHSNRTELYKEVDKILKQSYLSTKADNQIKFLEENIDKDNKCAHIIKIFLKENKMSKNEILEKRNRKTLKKMVYELKFIYSMSYRTIEKNIGISRETLRNLFK